MQWFTTCCKIECDVQISYQAAHNKIKVFKEDVIKLKVFEKPFAVGGCRVAYYAKDNTGNRLNTILSQLCQNPMLSMHQGQNTTLQALQHSP